MECRFPLCRRWMKTFICNDIHALSSNLLFKLTESALMKMKVSYAHDLRKSEGRSTTVYNIIGAAPIMVTEVTEASERSDISEHRE